MAGAACLLDTNILLRWVKPDSHDYPLVNSVIDRMIAEGSLLCYTSQNLAEFWNTCTRPIDRNGFGLSVAETDKRARLIEGVLQFLPDNEATHLAWRTLIVDFAVSGVQVHDARLVAAMRVHGLSRILTFNHRDFVRYTDITALHPLDMPTATL